MKYSKKFKLKLVRFLSNKNYSISAVALENGIPRQTLMRWLKRYSLFGEEGLENKKKGVKEKPPDEGFEKIVLDAWKKRNRSVYMMRRDLQKESLFEGIQISERQIRKIYDKWNLRKEEE